MEPVHLPVLLKEVVEYLSPQTDGALLVDGTLGEGGHSVAFLQSFPALRVIGVDADHIMVERARERLKAYAQRVEFVNDWFDAYLERTDECPDRVLLDLGISTFHLGGAARGFSFKGDEPLDMRLSRSGERTAADIVNTTDESDLADIIYQYGEERLSRRIARSIVETRRTKAIETTGELEKSIWRAVPASYRHGRIHPATRTFQALRIAVNDELSRVERALPAAANKLAPGGRLGVISFHSLEDRIVKHTFRSLAERDEFRVVTKKPIIPTEDEQRENPASRSAKLRVLERRQSA
ncbi:MAG: 16S rRNA (cytosine(1402)-N(4))-methyltransferase RsmH [Spirochaetales bacterium]